MPRCLGDAEPTDQQRHDAYRKVDQEHAPPPKRVNQEAAHERPERHCARSDPDPDDPGTGLTGTIAEQIWNERQGCGRSAAAPTPWTTRAAMRTAIDGAAAHAADAAVNTAMPDRNIRR